MAYCFITITTVQIGMFLSGLVVPLFYLNYTNSTENMEQSKSENTYKMAHTSRILKATLTKNFISCFNTQINANFMP